MTRRGTVAIVGAVAFVALLAWGLTAGLERVMRPTPRLAEERPPATDGPATPVRHITATLFLGSEDAQHLTPVQREVPFGEGSVEQGRQIVLAQIEAQAEGAQLRVVPTGAT